MLWLWHTCDTHTDLQDVLLQGLDVCESLHVLMDHHHLLQRILETSTHSRQTHAVTPAWSTTRLRVNQHNEAALTLTGRVFLSLITRPSSMTDCIWETAFSMRLSIRDSLPNTQTHVKLWKSSTVSWLQCASENAVHLPKQYKLLKRREMFNQLMSPVSSGRPPRLGRTVTSVLINTHRPQ